MSNILEIKNLTVTYNSEGKKLNAVENVSFTLKEGSTLGIIGESGSGKTSLALAIMGLINSLSEVSGDILYNNINLNNLSEKEKSSYRWNKIAIVFQNSLEVLNPVLTIEEQIIETIEKHTPLNDTEAKKKVINLLEMVGLNPTWIHHYPHQLSGGMRQKVLIAMALACDPEILIVDEPTTSLDPSSADTIINLLKDIQRNNNLTMIVISHELSILSKLTKNLLVMYTGHILEVGHTDEIIREPKHTYTRGIINSSLEIYPYHDLWGIPAEENKLSDILGCPFFYRCNQSLDSCQFIKPSLLNISDTRKISCNRGGIVTLLEGKGISKSYIMHNKPLKACKNCSITIRSGEIVVLIGESGSGKTTLASVLAGILKADEGEVIFENNTVIDNFATAKFHGIQMVFQDPFSATDSFMSIEGVIREPLDIIKFGNKADRKELIKEALKQVQLDYTDEFLNRKCHSLSGGQRQRVALARSLIMKPKVLIADEISTMLDPSTKANILRLLKGLQNSIGFSMLYITHDISLARKLADKVYVMRAGEIIKVSSDFDFFNDFQNVKNSHIIFN